MKEIRIGDIFEYLGDEQLALRIVMELVEGGVTGPRVVFEDDRWKRTLHGSGSCSEKMIGNIIAHVDDPESLPIWENAPQG